MRRSRPTRRRLKAGAARDNRQVVHARSSQMPTMHTASRRESYSIARSCWVVATFIVAIALFLGAISVTWHAGYDAGKVEVSRNA